MKWLKSDGRTLTVRDVGPVLFELRALTVPIKARDELLSDEAARAAVRELLATGLYDRSPPQLSSPPEGSTMEPEEPGSL